MTLAQSGTVPSVLQSPVEALIWPSSSPLNKRGEEKEEEEKTEKQWEQRERERKKERDKEKTNKVACTVRWSGKLKEIEEIKKEEASRVEMTVTLLCGTASAM